MDTNQEPIYAGTEKALSEVLGVGKKPRKPRPSEIAAKKAKKAAKKPAKAKKQKAAKKARKVTKTKAKKAAKRPKVKTMAAVARSERLDMRLTRGEKAKVHAKAQKLRRTVTSIVIEAIEKIK